MSTKRITIAKIGGVASDIVLEKFRRWQSQFNRKRYPEATMCPDHWPKKVHAQLDSFAEKLRANSADLSVVFFGEYKDMWSLLPFSWRMGLCTNKNGPNAINIWSDQNLGFCYKLPDRGRLLRILAKLLRSKYIRERNPQEDRYAISFLLEAVHSWEPFAKKAVIVIMEHTLRETALDEEVQESLTKSPKWLGKI